MVAGDRGGALVVCGDAGMGKSALLQAARRAGGLGGDMDRTGLGGAVVFAPEEAARQVSRERTALTQERTRLTNQLRGWLATEVTGASLK